MFDNIEFKKTFKDKDIFCYFISKICNFDFAFLIQHFIIIPTKNIKVVQGILFSKKIYLIQFIINEKTNIDTNKIILEKELLKNTKVSNYTTQIDKIIQINFNLSNINTYEIKIENYRDENCILPNDFYKIIHLNLNHMLKSNNDTYVNLAYLFLLNKYEVIKEEIKKNLT